jgi:hypothetical protein
VRLSFHVLAIAVVSLLLGAGSVTAARLLDGGDIRNGSLTGADVRAKSLTKADFRGSVRGPRGAQGPQGPPGPPGPPGTSALGKLIRVEEPLQRISPGSGIAEATVECPAGYGVVSGGVASSPPITYQSGVIFLSDSLGSVNSWSGGVSGLTGTDPPPYAVAAYCGPLRQALTPAQIARSQVRVETRIDALLAAGDR